MLEIDSIVELTLIAGKKGHFKRRSNSTTIYLLTLRLKKRSERSQRWCFKLSLIDREKFNILFLYYMVHVLLNTYKAK